MYSLFDINVKYSVAPMLSEYSYIPWEESVHYVSAIWLILDVNNLSVLYSVRAICMHQQQYSILCNIVRTINSTIPLLRARPNQLHIVNLYRIRFIFRLLSLNHKILYNLFYVYFADHFGVMSLAFTFRTLSDATRIVYEQYATIAQWRRDINDYHSWVLFSTIAQWRRDINDYHSRVLFSTIAQWRRDINDYHSRVFF